MKATSLFVDYLLVSLPISLIIAGLLIFSRMLSKHYLSNWKFWIWLILAVRLLLPFNFSFENSLFTFQIPENMAIERTEPSNAAVQPPDVEPANSGQGQVNRVDPPAAIPVEQAGEGISNPVSPPADLAANKTPGKTFAWLDIVAWIWCASAVLLLSYYLIGYFLFKRRVLRWSSPVQSTQADAIIAQVMAEMNIKRTIAVLTCEIVPNPMLIGF